MHKIVYVPVLSFEFELFTRWLSRFRSSQPWRLAVQRGLLQLVESPICTSAAAAPSMRFPFTSSRYTLDYLGLFMTFLFGTIYLVNITMSMPYACTMLLNLHVVARCYRGRDEGFCWSNNKYGDSKIKQYKKYWFTTTELPVYHCFLQG